MIRFILTHRQGECGTEFSRPVTLDCNVPELEALLRLGGWDSESGRYDTHELASVELLPTPNHETR